MGSLMAGWDSHVPDRKSVELRRNRSLTKDEIQTYWRSKKQKEEEHLRAISDLSHGNQENTLKETERSIQRSSSLPLASTTEKMSNTETEERLEKRFKKNGWWISSNWAFLNEPPVLISSEGPTSKYASQFHVAGTDTSKPQSHAGISA